MDGSLPTFEKRMAYIRSTHELEDQIIELAGHLNAANYRFLAVLAEFDRRKGWNVAPRGTVPTGSTGSAASTWVRRARMCALRAPWRSCRRSRLRWSEVRSATRTFAQSRAWRRL